MIAYTRVMTVSLVLVLLCAACDSGKGENQPKKNEGKTQTSVKTYQLNPQEKDLLGGIFYGQLYALADESDVLDFTKQRVGDYVVTSANQMQLDYEKNEVAGDIKYRKKIVFLKGQVASIDRSIGENYFIGLKGGSNPFLNPKAKMADGYTNYLAALEKGQTVKLVCDGDGMLMGSATVTACKPLSVYVEERTKAIIESVDKEMSKIIADESSKFRVLVVLSIVLAPKLQINSPCFTATFDNQKCNKELDQFLNQTSTMDELKNVAKKLGITLKDPTENKGVK